MPAVQTDIEVKQGSLFYMLLTIRGPTVGQTPGARIDLTGHVFRGQIRPTASKDTWSADFTFVVRDQTQLATRGQVEVRLSGATSTLIPVKSSSKPERTLTEAAYDIESQVVGQEPTRWMEGTVMISPEVTRA